MIGRLYRRTGESIVVSANVMMEQMSGTRWQVER